MRGALPLGSKSSDLVLCSPVRALRPAPCTYHCMRGALHLGSKSSDLVKVTKDAPGPSWSRVTFPTRGKSPKARQGLRPLESPGAWSRPSRSLHFVPACAGSPFSHRKRPICHFELGGQIGLIFSFGSKGNTFSCQSVARQVGFRGCLRL